MSRKTSCVLFTNEVNKVQVLEDEYLINYQYYDGDYSWIMIVSKEDVMDSDKKLKKNKDTILKRIDPKFHSGKVIRLTVNRDRGYALNFGFVLDKSKSTVEFLRISGFIDEKHQSLYDDEIEPPIEEEHSVTNIINLDGMITCDYKRADDLTVIKGDCMDSLQRVENKSIQTVCIDPPYNIGKDTWDNIDNYIDWLTGGVTSLEMKLKDNGSMFIFHNNMESISELMCSIMTHTNLKFIQMITWNKRYEGSKKKGFLDGFVVKKSAHKWELMAEYILFYTFDNTWKYKDERMKRKVCSKAIQKEVPSKTGRMTGWYTNIETGLNFPTKERMIPITKHLGLKYEDVVPKFINQKIHHSVWNYDSAKKHKKCSHVTPKPVDLLENLIKHTTDEGDYLLDCFAGTGSLGRACLNTKRKCVLSEREEEYFHFMKEELFEE